MTSIVDKMQSMSLKSAPRELLVRGNQVDQNGDVYPAVMLLTLHPNGYVTGETAEDGKYCKLLGTWDGSNVSYALNYPVEEYLVQYNFDGELSTNVKGNETLSGTWKLATKTDLVADTFGDFEFEAVPDETETEGSYELHVCGEQVDQNGDTYNTTVKATLHANGSVTGVSAEDGRRCKLTGEWDGSNISYTVNYPLNGKLVQYSFNGELETNDEGTEIFSGTWKLETRTANGDEIFGNFEFAPVDDDEAVEQSTRDLVVRGKQVDQKGDVYNTVVEATLHGNGSVTGVSTEDGKKCKLTGSWDGSFVTYTINYPQDGKLVRFTFAGVLRINANGNETFSGTWYLDTKSNEVDEVFGNFDFVAKATPAAA